MKRVVASEGRAVVLDVPEPELRPGEVLVAPAFSAISVGTETHIIHSTAQAETMGQDQYPSLRSPRAPQLRNPGTRWDGPRPRPQIPGTAAIGYSLAGTVLAVSSEVTDMQPGDKVACSGNQCAVHAERVAVPRSLAAHVPAGVPLDEAAFITLGTIGMHGLRRTGCQFGETVVIYGLGLLGLLATQVARQAGIYVIGVDIDDRRVAQALQLGATAAVNPNKQDPVEAVLQRTDGFGADGVVLCVVTPSSEPLNLAFDMSRHRGVVVGVGLFGMCIDRDRMYSKDVTYYPSIAYGPGRYDAVYEEGNVDYPIGYVRWTESRNMKAFLRLLAEKKIDLSFMAPERVPIAEAPRAYEILSRPDRPPTVLLTYDNA
ncbi:MAG: zinc-binding alcohol dehydrogenase [Chloroflexi bacterium]|nr:zinc-binding alcohol dehydrogenase [Chloroflexota bacterium]